MEYHFTKTLISEDFEEAVRCAADVLRQEGFEILSDADVSDVLRRALGVRCGNYRIIGVCHPALAYEALQIDSEIGMMLPCNVLVRDLGDGRVEVTAVSPLAMLQAIDSPRLRLVGERMEEKLCRVVTRL